MTKNETILLESISDRLEGIHSAIYGNGDPSKSMMASQVRQEAAIVVAAEAARAAACKADVLVDKMDIVVASANRHYATLHLSTLLKSPKTWGYALLVFTAVNVIIDVANPWVLALIEAWTGIAIP
jgi:hypothetical protein